MGGVEQEQHNDLIMSYHAVRQALGFLGLALPVILFLGGIFVLCDLRPSISDFYNSLLRDVFVGIMCAIGVFLCSYQGYRRDPSRGERLSDAVLARVAGVSAIGVALFPIQPSAAASLCNGTPHAAPPLSTLTQLLGAGTAEILHFISAAIFFVCLALFALVQFPKTRDPARRVKYIWCGLVIVAMIAALAVVALLNSYGSAEIKQVIAGYSLVFWLEAVAVWAFATSWLIKGKALISLKAAMRQLGG